MLGSLFCRMVNWIRYKLWHSHIYCIFSAFLTSFQNSRKRLYSVIFYSTAEENKCCPSFNGASCFCANRIKNSSLIAPKLFFPCSWIAPKKECQLRQFTCKMSLEIVISNISRKNMKMKYKLKIYLKMPNRYNPHLTR